MRYNEVYEEYSFSHLKFEGFFFRKWHFSRKLNKCCIHAGVERMPAGFQMSADRMPEVKQEGYRRVVGRIAEGR